MEPLSGAPALATAKRILARRRSVLVLSVCAAGAAALFWSLMSTPMYRATAILQIERQSADVLTFQGLNSPESSWVGYANYYQTQYEILASEAVAERAANALELVDRPQLTSSGSGPGPIGRVLSWLPRRTPVRERSPQEAAIDVIRGGLEITPVINSELVRVSWISPDPAFAAEVANAVVSSYIRYNLTSRLSTSDEAAEFLREQITKIKYEIEAKDRQLQEYGEQKGIVSVHGTNDIALQALTDLGARRTVAESSLAAADAHWRAVRDSRDEAVPEVQSSPVIQGLKTEAASLEARLSERSKLFKDDWPEIRSLRSRLAEVSSQIDRETVEIAHRVRLGARTRLEQARNEVANFDRMLREHRELAQRGKRDAVEYNNLRSEVDNLRETLDALIERQTQIAINSRLVEDEGTSSNVHVVASAKPPAAPFRPRTVLNVLFGLFVGLLFGVVGALALEQIDNTVSDPEEIEALTGVPTLAWIPRHGEVESDTKARSDVPIEMISYRDRHAPASEAYLDLRTAILLSGTGRPPRRIMVTSALPGEGKSSTSTNLAICLALAGRRVILVDADLRRPALHRTFGVSSRRGLSTLLSGMESDPSALAVETEVPGLDLLPSGPPPPNPAEMLDSERFEEMLNALVDRYTHVVVDSPPTLPVTDPLIMATHVDAFVIVARAESTPRPSLRHTIEKYRQSGLRPVGIVLNDLRSDRGIYQYARYRYAGKEPSPTVRDTGTA